MKNLIITADDYGVFPAINEGIIDAVNAGKVTSVSVLSNYKGEVSNRARPGTRFDDSVTNVKWLLNNTTANPPEIGCHLTVTSGKPLTGNKMEFACDDNGNFNTFSSFKNFSSKQSLDNLYSELCAQIEVLRGVRGCDVKHLTNHHNSLTLFKHHFEVYLKVAADFNLPIRSANVLPAQRQEMYLWLQDRLLTLDIPREERRQMMEFQNEIVSFFNSNTHGIKGPDQLDGRHYGPIGLTPWARLIAMGQVKKKRKKIDSFIQEFRDSESKSAEFLLHIAKAGAILVDKSHDLDYSGVDRNYFDSRVLEFNSIIGYDFSNADHFSFQGWSRL